MFTRTSASEAKGTWQVRAWHVREFSDGHVGEWDNSSFLEFTYVKIESGEWKVKGWRPHGGLAMIGVCKILYRRLRAFAGAKAGNVAMTFGLATLPVIGGVGAAIDFSHAHSVKAAMQAALDSTALMFIWSLSVICGSRVILGKAVHRSGSG